MPLPARHGRTEPRPTVRPREGNSPSYLAWLRTLPCLVTAADPGGDPHHLLRAFNEDGKRAARGTGLRTVDRYAVPVCRWIHDAAHHAPDGDDEALFASLGFDVRSLTSRLWSMRSWPDRDQRARDLIFKLQQEARLKVKGWASVLRALHAKHGPKA